MAETKFISELSLSAGEAVGDPLSQRLFHSTGAARFIARHKVVNSYEAPFDMSATAQKLGARIERSVSDLGEGGRLTVDNDEWVIQLGAGLRPDYPAEQFVFGHEVGHIFIFSYLLARGGVQAVRRHRALTGIWEGLRDERYYDRTEKFCDYFAHRMVQYD